MKNTDTNHSSLFSPRQKRIVAAGVTAFCGALVIAFAGGVLWAVGKLLSAVSVVITPLLVAIILAVIFKPFYRWLYQRLWRIHALALGVFFAVVFVPVVLTVGVFGSLMVRQLISFVWYLPSLVENVGAAMPHLHAFLERLGLDEPTREYYLNAEYWSDLILSAFSFDALGGAALAYGLGGIKYLASLVGWLVVPVYLAYFLATKPFKGESVEEYLPFLSKKLRDDVAYLIDEFLLILASFFRGQLLIVLIQGVLYGLAFWLIGLPYGLLVGFSLGCINLVPYLGSIVGLSVTLPLALFGEGGSWVRLCLVLVVFGAVHALNSAVLTPKIQGKRTGLHDITITFSLLFWGVVFGNVMGVLLAIPLSAFVVVFWRLLKTKYIREVV